MFEKGYEMEQNFHKKIESVNASRFTPHSVTAQRSDKAQGGMRSNRGNSLHCRPVK
jgi:hypothetical protein